MQRKHTIQTIFTAILIFAALAATAQTTTQKAALSRCTATTKAGEPCKGYAYKDGPTCYSHTPEAHAKPAHVCGSSTAAGTACKRGVKNQGDKCHQHADNVTRCSSPTTAGTPCKRTVKTAGTKCPQHTK